jgi:hypothetical protein
VGPTVTPPSTQSAVLTPTRSKVGHVLDYRMRLTRQSPGEQIEVSVGREWISSTRILLLEGPVGARDLPTSPSTRITLSQQIAIVP